MKVELFQTNELFRTRLMREATCVQDLCRAVPQVWITRNPLPGGHFGTYFGALPFRKPKYNNPMIEDIYHLHELKHYAMFAGNYRPERPFADWVRAMTRYEFEASLLTECLVYLDVPGLRAQTFGHEIWVDRFLSIIEPWRTLEAHERLALEQHIRAERRRALNAPDFDDYLEHQIHNYRLQNIDWCRLWAEPVGYGKYKDRPAFRVVEEHMADPDRDAKHEAWIRSLLPPARLGLPPVPFAIHAVNFEARYLKTVAEYGNAVLTR